MISTAELERTLEYLRAIYPERQAELEPLSERIRSSSGRSLADRSNSEGHLTVSGTVLHVRTGRVLLLHHRALGLWIPPGGHIEPGDDSLPAAAAREVCEETGICGHALRPVCMSGGLQTALDFDVFTVPANERRGRGAPALQSALPVPLRRAGGGAYRARRIAGLSLVSARRSLCAAALREDLEPAAAACSLPR